MAYDHIQPAAAKAVLDSDPTAAYVDVRTVEEFQMGHVPGAYNVPVAVRDPVGRMSLNSDFVSTMKKLFALDRALIVGCASGMRSQSACALLEEAGFTRAANMEHGFMGARDPSGRTLPGWRALGYPCATDSDRERTYAGIQGAR